MARKHSGWMRFLAFILCWSTSVAMAQTPVTLPGLQGYLATYGTNNRVGGTQKPWVNVITDCSVPSDHVSDVTASVNACIAAHNGATLYFPKTNGTLTGPSYLFTTGAISLVGAQIELVGDGNCGLSAVNCTQLLFSNLATDGIDIGLLNTCQGCAIKDLDIRGSWPTVLAHGGIVDNWLPCNPPSNQTYSAGTVCVTAGDGIKIQTNFVTLEHVTVERFGGACINQDGSATTAGDNYNYIDVSGDECHADGIWGHAGDANAGSTLQSHAYYNLMWGFDKTEFLSSTDYSPNATANHLPGASIGATKAISSYSCNGSVCTMNFSVAHGFKSFGGNVIVVAGTSIDGTYGVVSSPTTQQITFNLASSSTGGAAGTARLASTNEFYTFTGVLGGAFYIHGSNVDPVIINGYVEGGQVCDFARNTILIGGTAAQCLDASGSQSNAYRLGNLSGLPGQITQSTFGVNWKLDSALVMPLRAGATASQTIEYRMYDFDASTTNWWYGSGVISAAQNFFIAPGSTTLEPIVQQCNNTAQICALRIISGSDTRIAATGATGRVDFGRQSGAGTGGYHFYTGGSPSTESASIEASTGRYITTLSTPGSSSATCTAGSIWADASFVYVCTATNTIKRATLSAF